MKLEYARVCLQGVPYFYMRLPLSSGMDDLSCPFPRRSWPRRTSSSIENAVEHSGYHGEMGHALLWYQDRLALSVSCTTDTGGGHFSLCFILRRLPTNMSP